ncbi:HD-GYP domain-containing protein [Virgibacillus salinus]|uniref:HDIG domain-containing protein n=1 Tax=Virgibacillus salinus TaxID=553311 RepID=A0A1H0ZLA4_9BACI|nr:HD-GYP domain-containing protein [Virgibacillus salinus]SDQ28154.1 HDIG domain-containing protein [Virgibacillus salinus]
MRLVSTKSIQPGTTLAQTIYNDNGQVLIQKGLGLTERVIRRLINLGITYVYIKDELTDDIHIESPISEKLRMEASNTIKETFSKMRQDGYMNNSHILNKQGKKLTDIVQQIMEEIQNNSDTVSLLADIFVTDDYIFQHSINVTIYSIAIGIELGLSKKELSEIGTGAMLHDVGKVFIDQDILQKPDKLDSDEFEIIKSHTQLGYDFLRKQLDLPLLVAHCAYQHHERLDGSGYPRGIEGDQLHKYAKLIGVADVFDAVTSNRVYRDAKLPHEGLEVLYAGAIKLFDKEIVEAFKKSVAVYPNGLTVKLSDGRNGIVSQQNNHLCDRPIIRVFKENGMEVEPYEIDLATILNVTITSCNLES